MVYSYNTPYNLSFALFNGAIVFIPRIAIEQNPAINRDLQRKKILEPEKKLVLSVSNSCTEIRIRFLLTRSAYTVFQSKRSYVATHLDGKTMQFNHNFDFFWYK